MSFGWSVGDLITALKLLHQVGTVLKDAGGASSDFQDHVSFLETLSRTLQHLNALQALPLDAGVANNLREQCDHVQGPLRHFLDDIKSSFEPSLGSSSNMNQFCAAPRKVRWALSTSKRIKRLQDRIATPMASISLILGQQVIQTTLAMPSVIQEQIAHTLATAIDSDLKPLTTQVSNQLGNLAAGQSNIIRNIRLQTLEDRTRAANFHNKLDQIDTTNRFLGHSLHNLSLSQNIQTPDSFHTEIKTAIRNITRSIWLLLTSLQLLIRELLLLLAPYLLGIYRRTIRPLMLSGDFFIFEDALGRVQRLPCAQFQHWDMFYSRLKSCFEDTPGLSLILSDRFILMNGYNNFFISKEAWRAVIQPNSKVVMAMVLKDALIPCERCANHSGTRGYSSRPAKAVQICLACKKHSLPLKKYWASSRKSLSMETVYLEASSSTTTSTPQKCQTKVHDNSLVGEKETVYFKRVVWEEENLSVNAHLQESHISAQQPTLDNRPATESLTEQKLGTGNKSSFQNYRSCNRLQGWFRCCCCLREVSPAWGEICPD